MSSTSTTTTVTDGPSILEQGKDAVTSAGQSVANAVGLESDAHKAGRKTGEAVSGTAKAAGDAVQGAVEGGK